MRAITVRQPWAWAIVHGGKNVENRTRNIAGAYRGPVSIHAGLAWDEPGSHDPNVAESFVDALARNHWRSRDPEGLRDGLIRDGVPQDFFPTNTFGAVIGVAELVDVHWCEGGMCCRPWGMHAYHTGPRRLCDPINAQVAQPEFLHLVLENQRPLARPIPARGLLGLWTPSAPLVAAINAQLEEAA